MIGNENWPCCFAEYDGVLFWACELIESGLLHVCEFVICCVALGWFSVFAEFCLCLNIWDVVEHVEEILCEKDGWFYVIVSIVVFDVADALEPLLDFSLSLSCHSELLELRAEDICWIWEVLGCEDWLDVAPACWVVLGLELCEWCEVREVVCEGEVVCGREVVVELEEACACGFCLLDEL